MQNSPKIVVVGSLNMDLVVSASAFPQKGETITGSGIYYIPGGKGANQAVACARLGAAVSMIGAVGEDQFGAQLLDALGQEGIDTSGVIVMPKTATGVASIIHAEQDNSIIVVPGANGQLTAELIERQRHKVEAADVLLVQLEIPTSAVEAALRIAKQASVVTILNPAPAAQLPYSLLHMVDYITPNETELQVCCRLLDIKLDLDISVIGVAGAVDGDVVGEGPQGGVQHALQAWSNASLPSIVMTLGSKGALLYRNQKLTMKRAPVVEVVDTTGAGDCLNGAFATCLAKGMSAEEALDYAVHAASQSVQVFGAQAGMPTWEQLTNRFENFLR